MIQDAAPENRSRVGQGAPVSADESPLGGAMAVSASELNAMLRRGSTPVLAYVWAPWCPPCKTMSPTMDEVARHFGRELRVVKLDPASESQALTAFGIASVPTLLLFAADGRERARLLGGLTRAAVIDWVARKGLDPAEPPAS